MSGNHTVTVHISYSFSVVCIYFRNLHVTFLCSVSVSSFLSTFVAFLKLTPTSELGYRFLL